MSTFRVNKTKNYTVMCNNHLKEKTMSLRAKGLLSIMLSLPDNWDYTVDGLSSICVETPNTIKTILSELQEFRYLKITKMQPNQTQSGRFEYIYDIYETPYTNETFIDRTNENYKSSEDKTRPLKTRPCFLDLVSYNKEYNNIYNKNTKYNKLLLNTIVSNNNSVLQKENAKNKKSLIQIPQKSVNKDLMLKVLENPKDKTINESVQSTRKDYKRNSY